MAKVKTISIQQALQNVADNPVMLTDELIQVPMHELLCRSLFDIANHPDGSQRGSLRKANKARKMIADRLVGRRRAGSHPATNASTPIEFVDLTGGILDNAEPSIPTAEL